MTARLRLRAPSAADFPFIFSASRYPNFNDGMQWEPPATMAELQAPLERGLQAWKEGRGYAFTLERKEDAEFIGRISIREEEEEDVWNIGFWTHPTQQGKGYMTEAVAAIIDFGFQKLGAKRIEAAYATWNKASERVLQRNGMTFVKYLEQGFQKRGEWVAENVMAIERDTSSASQQTQMTLEEMEQMRLRYRRRRPLQILCFVIALAFLLLAVFASWWWLVASGLFFCCGVYLALDALSYVQAYKTRLLTERLGLEFGPHIQYRPDEGVPESLINESPIFAGLLVEKMESEDWLGGQWQGLTFQMCELRVLGRLRKMGRSHKREPFFSGLFLMIEKRLSVSHILLFLPHARNRYMDHRYKLAQQQLREIPAQLSTHTLFVEAEAAVSDTDVINVSSSMQDITNGWANAFIAITPERLFIARPLDHPFLEPDLQRSVWDEHDLDRAVEQIGQVLGVVGSFG